MPDNDHDKELKDKLKEQESSMEQKPPVLREISGESTDIPVLDELVTPEKNDDNYDPRREKEPGGQNIDDIAEQIEKKLSTELDEIVTLLRDTLKDSIKTELKDQIKEDTDKKSDS